LGFHVIESINIKVKIPGLEFCGNCADILAEKLDVNHGIETEKPKRLFYQFDRTLAVFSCRILYGKGQHWQIGHIGRPAFSSGTAGW